MISEINNSLLVEKQSRLDLLRLDLLHPHVSGNKWYKLKFNIEEAIKQNASSILSFGGAYSNHLHALAYVGKLFSIPTIGIVRGEKVKNDTLSDCEQWGMKLIFISREKYKQKVNFEFLEGLKQEFPNTYIVPEGGGNQLGFLGCQTLLSKDILKKYEVICCAVGTGTTLAGIAESLLENQKVVGFCGMKGGSYLTEHISTLTLRNNFELIDKYHFGGFGKANQELLFFIQAFYKTHHIELDFVYNGKMLFGLFDQLKSSNLFDNKNILAIHCGGLQGNRSLPSSFASL